MIKTLVTGGTGFLGSAIARQLVLGNETVSVLSRDWMRISRENRVAGVLYVQGSIFGESDMEKALEGCDALVNAVQFDGAPFENPRRGQTYERVDGEGTERQIIAAKKAGIKRVIYISGAGTAGGRKEPWFKAKLRAEKAIQESGMDWTIFRPSWIYGPGDRSLNRFAMFARLSPIIPIIGSGKGKIRPISVEDVARAIGLSLQDQKTFGKIFELGGPEELTMLETLQTMLRVQGRRRWILPHPKPLMKFTARFAELLPEPIRFLTRDGVDFVTMEEAADPSPFLETFPDFKLTELEDGLRKYLGLRVPIAATHRTISTR